MTNSIKLGNGEFPNLHVGDQVKVLWNFRTVPITVRSIYLEKDPHNLTDKDSYWVVVSERGFHYPLSTVIVAAENSARNVILQMHDSEGELVQKSRDIPNPLDPNFKGKVGDFVRWERKEGEFQVGVLVFYDSMMGRWQVSLVQDRVTVFNNDGYTRDIIEIEPHLLQVGVFQ